MKKLSSLFLALTILAGFTLLTGCSPTNAGFGTMTSQEAYDFLQTTTDANVMVIDVRSEEEFMNGRVRGAISLPLEEIEERMSDITKDKTTTILVICRSGVRSQAASQIMADLGFTNVYDIGGILSWPGEIVD